MSRHKIELIYEEALDKILSNVLVLILSIFSLQSAVRISHVK